MIKIIIFALCCAFLIVILKNVNSEFYNLAIICSGIILLLTAVDYLSETVLFIQKIKNLSNINNGILKTIFKIVGIGYLTEFASSTLIDFGLDSMSKKIIFVGKIIILTVSIPLFNSLLELLNQLIWKNAY